MSQEIVISVENASKKFVKGLNYSMLYGLSDIACDVFGLSTKSDQLRKNEFWAVKDTSFELKRGETLGVIGPNGSGKTTLLKMLSGVINPDKGQIRVKGRVGALIEVGAGFHPMLTGRENIYINGAILGMSRDEIKRKFDSIIDFAEIGDFLDVPVKNYSSGMYVRLGFAVAAHCRPDVLIVDEVLSVGDISFQKKCSRFFEEEVLDKGVTLILVSHSMYAVARMCSRALLLHKGEVKYLGDSQQAVPEFYRLMRQFSGGAQNIVVDKAGNIRPGAGEVRVQSVKLVNGSGQEQPRVRSGDKTEIQMVLRAERDFKRMPNVTFQLHDASNTIMAYCTLPQQERQSFYLKQGDNLVRCVLSSLNLMPGNYTIVVKIGGGGDLLHDNLLNAGTIEVVDVDNDVYKNTLGVGMVYLSTRWMLA